MNTPAQRSEAKTSLNLAQKSKLVGESVFAKDLSTFARSHFWRPGLSLKEPCPICLNALQIFTKTLSPTSLAAPASHQHAPSALPDQLDTLLAPGSSIQHTDSPSPFVPSMPPFTPFIPSDSRQLRFSRKQPATHNIATSSATRRPTQKRRPC